MYMARDLTTSQIDRQNILNNENAVAEIQNQTGLQEIILEGRLRFTKAVELLKLHYLILMMLLETMFPWEIANMQFIRIKFTKAFLGKWKKIFKR